MEKNTVFKIFEERFLRNLNREILQNGIMVDKVATDQKKRKVKIDGKWMIDFASCNYLGFDLCQEIIDAIPGMLLKWGVHPSWSKVIIQPEPYVMIEQKLAKLIGAENVFILPTITLIHVGLIPALSLKKGVILVDRFAHNSVHRGCAVAKSNGSEVFIFRHQNMEELEELLQKYFNAPSKLICTDGVFSTTGSYAAIEKMAQLARNYDAILYIDDAHGFGIIGENPSEENPYGYKGNGIIKYFNETYDNIIYVSGLSKAYSSLAAFFSCPSSLVNFFKANVEPYLFSGPISTASFASILSGLEVNEKSGGIIRSKIFRLTKRLIDGLHTLDFNVINKNYFPIVSFYFGKDEYAREIANMLMEEGIFATLMVFPTAPRNRGCIRATITAENTLEEIDIFLTAMERVKELIKSPVC